VEPRLIKGLHADYKPAAWNGQDTSGIRPLGPHVVVLPDECSDITTGSVHLPLDIVEKMNLASEQGVIVKLGGSAFSIYEDGRPWKLDERPQPGERIYFEKYAGRLARGIDGVMYRIMEYRQIAAVYEPIYAGATLEAA
jgi:chaperonin GroES